MHPVDPSTILAGVPRHPETIDEALFALDTVAARLWASRDARAVFPDVYAIITRRVAESVRGERGPAFHEPEFISRLAGRFCERYIDWLEASLEGRALTSEAWQVACEYGARGRTIPAQDALLGISAHINFDLAQGIRDSVAAHPAGRRAEMLARFRHDHDAVNEILRDSVHECLDRLVNHFGCRVTAGLTYLSPCRTVLANALLAMFAAWRARVWDEMLALLDAGDARALDAVLARTDRLSGRVARALVAGNVAYDAVEPWLPSRVRAGVARVGLALRSEHARPNRSTTLSAGFESGHAASAPTRATPWGWAPTISSA